MNKVVVVGSLSQDLVVKAPRRPLKGETLRGTDFGMFAGGKGNNQALAAARAGADVVMVGRVGCDTFGEMLLDTLEKNRIDTTFMTKDPTVGTGIAVITVDGEGDNSIIIAQQANLKLCKDDVERARAVIASSDVLLMQLEVLTETVMAAAEVAHSAGVTVVLNPAPAPDDGELPAKLLSIVDIFIPNQTEAELLTKIAVTDQASAEKAAQALRLLGPKMVIITMGDQGAYVHSDSIALLVSSFSVNAVDSTAAGDAFCGAFAAALASKKGAIAESVAFACAAGALAATKLGAEPSLPSIQEIEKLIDKAKLSAVKA